MPRRIIAVFTSLRPTQQLMAVVAVGALLWSLAAIWFLAFSDFALAGPGSPEQARIEVSEIPPPVLATARQSEYDFRTNYAVRASRVVMDPAHPLWILYAFYESGGIASVLVVDEATSQVVTDPALIKPTGAWPQVGIMISATNWIMGLVLLLGAGFAIARWASRSAWRARLARRTPQTGMMRRFFSSWWGIILSNFFLPGAGLLVIALAPGWNRAQKALVFYRFGAGLLVLGVIVTWARASGAHDPAGQVAMGVWGGTILAAWLVGWFRLRPAQMLPAVELEDTRIRHPMDAPTEGTETAERWALQTAVRQGEVERLFRTYWRRGDGEAIARSLHELFGEVTPAWPALEQTTALLAPIFAELLALRAGAPYALTAVVPVEFVNHMVEAADTMLEQMGTCVERLALLVAQGVRSAGLDEQLTRESARLTECLCGAVQLAREGLAELSFARSGSTNDPSATTRNDELLSALGEAAKELAD